MDGEAMLAEITRLNTALIRASFLLKQVPNMPVVDEIRFVLEDGQTPPDRKARFLRAVEEIEG